MIRHIYIAIALVGLGCAGCATTTPAAQVRLVGKAFEDLNSASAPLFDDFAVAERENGKGSADQRAKDRSNGKTIPENLDRCKSILALPAGDRNVQKGFCPDDSYYYSVLADPPATATFRRSIAAVQGYTNVLLILAEGRNLDAAQAEVQGLAGNLGGVLEIAGAGQYAVALKGFATAIQPLLDVAARHANAKELARNVKQVSPKVIDVLEALRTSAPSMFDILTEESMENLTDDRKKSTRDADVRRIEAYREAMSNYIVLLDQYERLLAQLVASYDPEGKTVTLANLVDKSAELSAQADAWRRTYSALRMGH